MPSEPLPWDRRDFRKRERSGSDPRLGGVGFSGVGHHRWRELEHHPLPYQQQQQRWFSDFRFSRLLPPAEGHLYSDDAGQGHLPLGSRYTDRNMEDENCLPFGSCGDGTYFRNNRVNWDFFTRKGWKAPSGEPAKSSSAPLKSITEVNNLRSTENTQQCNVGRNLVNLSEQPQSEPLLKEKNNKNSGAADETTGAGLESEKENCLGSVGWKHLKLSRMGCLSQGGSCFRHSSSSKSVGVGSSSIVAEVQPKNARVIQSPADGSCVRSAPILSDETGSRKKRRLGWGEGLAKYEKKRVECPGGGELKNELVLSVTNIEFPQLQSVNSPEKSPKVASSSDCASPGTPSVACSSSPGIEEKGLVKEAVVGHDTTILSCSPSIGPQTHYDSPTFNLQNLELASIANMSSLINELLQSNDPTTSMNKLLVLKVDTLKALEMTEFGIESLETELKLLIVKPRICGPVGSSSLPGEERLKPCERIVTASRCGIKLDSLQINSSGEMNVENAPVGPGDAHISLKDEDIDSPGSATSKFVGLLPVIFPSETAKVTEGSTNLDVNNSSNLDDKCLKNDLSYEEKSGYVENRELTGTTNKDLAGVSNVHCEGDHIHDSIFSCNRDAASRSMEQLNKLLPKHLLFKSSIVSNVSSSQSDSSVVKEKILMRKRILRFKEKVLTLKFKVFQHFWKQGRLVPIRKIRGRTRKKFDPSRNGHKSNHSSLRSCVSSHAGGPQIVPPDEVIEFINGLLSECAFKPCGSTLKMPALILEKEVKMSRFISNNGLVEDPCAVEKERSMINPWTSEEKEIFVDKLAAFGKDFSKIASFLDHRTVADCIDFYYKNHKSKCFEKTRKNPYSLKQRKSQSKTYLVASGKRRNPELNVASLEILGAASETATNIDNGSNSQLKCPSRFSYGASSSRRAPRGDDGQLQGSDSTNTYSNEREREAADVLASICGSLSSEGVSSCITSSVDKPGDGYQDHGGLKISCSIKRPLTTEVIQDVDDECSDVSCGELSTTDWSDEEKSIFVQAVSIYGKDFVMISQCLGTRSMHQCKLFFSKARKCLELDLIQPGGGTMLVDDNGGDSDFEDGCSVESGSVICNNGSECKVEDLPPSEIKLNHQSDVVEPQNLRPDFEVSKGNNGPCPLDYATAEPFSKDSSTQTVVVSSHTESEQGVEEEDDCCMANGLNEAENKALVEVSDRCGGEENQQQGPSSPKGIADNKIVRDAISSEVSDISSVTSEMKSEPQPSTGDCQQHLPGHSSSDSMGSSQILWGYPVSVQIMKERIGDVNCDKLPALPDVPEQNRNLNSDQHRDFFLEKCNGSRQRSTVVEGPFPSLGRSRDHSSPQSGCSSAGEGPSGNGGVKLFGKILISSQQKTNNFVQRADGNNRQDHKIGHESLNLKLGAHQKTNLDFVQPKFDCNTYVGAENIPVGSLGFWDGNSIRTGIPPLPDSALLLAKYPAAFSNYASLNMKLDQPPLHGTVKSNDHPMTLFSCNVVSSSSGLADYCIKNRELQPFTIGMKQRQDAFNEMHRINSFDLVSGMHNVVGRGGGFVGGQCSSLTDPVTAMKMHYAKVEQLSMKGGNIIKEDDRRIRQ